MAKEIHIITESEQRIVIKKEPNGCSQIFLNVLEDDGINHSFLIYLEVDEARELGQELIQLSDELENES